MEAAVETGTTAANVPVSAALTTSSSETTPNGASENVTEAATAPSTSTVTTTPSKTSTRSSGGKSKSTASVATDGDGLVSAKEGNEKEERRSGQKASKSSSRHTRSDRSDHDGTTAGGTEVEVKKFKKEPKEALVISGDSGSRPTPTATVTSSFTTAGYPASSYLQGLANLPHPYASLFAAAADPATAAAANAFLTASHFGYASSTPTDLSSGKDNGATGRNHSGTGALLNSLNQTDTSALRQLANGYREAAALLSRTADELESFLCTRK